MNKTVSVTPGRISVIGARIGALVAALFLVFGCTFAYVVLQDSSSDEPGLRLLIGMFFAIWVIACAAMLLFYLRIGFAKGAAKANSLLDLKVDEPGREQDKAPPKS